MIFQTRMLRQQVEEEEEVVACLQEKLKTTSLTVGFFFQIAIYLATWGLKP